MKVIRILKKLVWILYKPIKIRIKFYMDFRKFNKEAISLKALKKDLIPCYFDSTPFTEIEPVYFYQDVWAFEKIYLNKPAKHVDIGSNYKFVSFLSKVTQVIMIDIRPLSLSLNTLEFIKGDILKLPFRNESIESLSSLCVIEHIGLGRYGDKIDPDGSEKAFIEINRVLKIGAQFYFSVPVEGKMKVYFNAHRAFSEEYLFSTFLRNYIVLDKRYIYGNRFEKAYDPSRYGIGCFHLQKTK